MLFRSNFANDTSPPSPLTGQLWWDAAGNLKVYTGSSFTSLGAITVNANTAPSGAVTGNFWWDEYGKQLRVYDGSDWVLVGPATSANTGISGVYVGNITDNTSVERVATNIWVNSTLVAIVSNSAAYIPQTSLPGGGFSVIKPGINLSANADLSAGFWGTANNANYLGDIVSTNYARLDKDDIFKIGRAHV